MLLVCRCYTAFNPPTVIVGSGQVYVLDISPLYSSTNKAVGDLSSLLVVSTVQRIHPLSINLVSDLYGPQRDLNPSQVIRIFNGILPRDHSTGDICTLLWFVGNLLHLILLL